MNQIMEPQLVPYLLRDSHIEHNRRKHIVPKFKDLSTPFGGTSCEKLCAYCVAACPDEGGMVQNS
jgi:hypothetical protein